MLSARSASTYTNLFPNTLFPLEEESFNGEKNATIYTGVFWSSSI